MGVNIKEARELIKLILVSRINNLEIGDIIVYERDSHGNDEDYLIISCLDGIRLLDIKDSVLLVGVYDDLDRLKRELLDDKYVDNIIKRDKVKIVY